METGDDQTFFKSDERDKKSRRYSYRNAIRTAIVLGVLLIFLVVVIILIWLSWPAPYVRQYHYQHAAVASDSAQCSTIGKEILRDRNGSAVDSAIATLLCLGLHSMMSCGLGGGFFMVVYDVPTNKSVKDVKVFDAREVAPAAATKDMFVNGTSDYYGGKAIAVPGELRGYHEAWKQFGRLPWKDLFTPTIELCKNGYRVGWALSRYIKEAEPMIRNTTGLRRILVKDDGSLYTEGDLLKRPDLAKTLERIQDDPESFYTGSLAQDIADDIKDFNGIITKEDLRKYKVKQGDPLSLDFNNHEYTLFSLRPPSSGVLLGFMLRVLEGFNLTSADLFGTSKKTETYQKIVETFKFGYAMRSYLGDEDFVDVTKIMKNLTSYEFANYIRSRITLDHTQNVSYYHPEFSTTSDHGTSHLSIIAPNGGAVSVTSTVNSVFGSMMVGSRTGILFNDEMGDFVKPGPSKPLGNEDYIVPGKRPMSSMCPGIIVDKNRNTVMVIGGAGGKQITSATTYVAAHIYMLGLNAYKTVNEPRLHHQLEPNVLYHEDDFSKGVLNGLAAKGHVVDVKTGFSSVIQLIESTCHQPDHLDGCLTAVCDPRKRGIPDGF